MFFHEPKLYVYIIRVEWEKRCFDFHEIFICYLLWVEIVLIKFSALANYWGEARSPQSSGIFEKKNRVFHDFDPFKKGLKENA